MFTNKKLLIVPMIGGRGLGPIYRSLALAEASKSKFDIKFLCKERFMSLAKEQGFTGWIDIEPSPKMQQGHIVTWDDAAYAMGLCDEKFVKAAVTHQLEIVSQYKPDIIFTEYNITILLVALILNIPIVSTVNWADTPNFNLPEIDCSVKNKDAIKPYNEILHKYNKSLYRSISELVSFAPQLLAPTIIELQPELYEYHVTYVGELLNRQIEESNISEKFENGNIYVYLTSSDICTKEWLQVIIRELKNCSRRVYVVSNKEVYDCLKMYDVSELINFEFRNHFPSLSVMEKSSLVIHSGSANIISGALLKGVPSIMIPLVDGERLYNAKSVVKNGCGFIISENNFFAEGFLKEKIRELLCTNTSSKIKEIGDKIRKAGGPSAVVSFLSNVINNANDV